MKKKKEIEDLIDSLIISILYFVLFSSTLKIIDDMNSNLIYSYCVNNETVVIP